MDTVGRGIRWLCAAVLLVGAVGGCSSTKSASEGSGAGRADQGPSNPIYEIEPYLVEDEALAMLKVRPAEWGRVQGLLAEMFTASVAGGSYESWGSAAEKGPVALATEILGYDLKLEHLDPKRPSYLIFTPRRHNPWQGCLATGLPCVLFEAPGPRYGRFILAAEDAGKLADEIRGALEKGKYRVVEMEYHVRVEFATSNVEGKAIEKHLDVRAKDEPEDDYYGRRSPAREAVLAEDVPFGMYVNLRGAIDGAMYHEAWELADRIQDVPEGERMRAVLAGSADIGRLTHLDMPEQAEVEDVSLTADGSGDSYRLRVVSTRTRFGRKLAEAREGTVELPRIRLDGPALAVEWNVQMHALDEEVDPQEWLASEERRHYPSLADLGEWAWVGVWRAPTTISASVADRMRGLVGGSDLSRVVAGRMRVGTTGESPSSGWKALRGGAALHLAVDSKSNEFLGAMQAIGEAVGPIETRIVEHSDGHYEVRFAVNASLGEVFPDDQSKTQAERFAFRAPAKTAKQLAAIAREVGAAEFAPVTTRIVTGMAENGPLRITHRSEETWTGLAFDLGSGEAATVEFDSPEFEIRQPRPYCLDEAAQRSAKVIERALGKERTETYLAEFFTTSDGQAFRNTIVECGGEDVGETDLSTWATSYLDAWKALTQYRLGDRKWSREMLQVCEEGRPWACGPEEGTWPWIRIGRDSSAAK